LISPDTLYELLGWADNHRSAGPGACLMYAAQNDPTWAVFLQDDPPWAISSDSGPIWAIWRCQPLALQRPARRQIPVAAPS